MSQALGHGKFQQEVASRLKAKDEFVPARVEDVIIANRVAYYSGPVGSGIKHVGDLDVISRFDERNNRNIRISRAAPDVYLGLSVERIRETVYISMPPSQIVQFGGFKWIGGNFSLTTHDVKARVSTNLVEIKGYGSFSRVQDPGNSLSTYASGTNNHGGLFDKKQECWDIVDERLRDAWARNIGVYAGSFEVESVKDSSITSRVTITVIVENESFQDTLSFSVSMNDWDDNDALRELVEDDCNGDIGNLEGREVFLSREKLTGAIAEKSGWYLYRDSTIRSTFSNLKVFVHSLF